jgi:DNA mismatch endonuclease, patch repair protein
MVELLRAAHLVGWRRHVQLRPKKSAEDFEHSTVKKADRILTRPDFVFRSAKVALFIDGCFWHGCRIHSTAPAQNAEFWSAKLSRNVQRDRVQTRALEQAGWQVLRIWEHELRDRDALTKRLLRLLRCATG